MNNVIKSKNQKEMSITPQELDDNELENTNTTILNPMNASTSPTSSSIPVKTSQFPSSQPVNSSIKLNSSSFKTYEKRFTYNASIGQRQFIDSKRTINIVFLSIPFILVFMLYISLAYRYLNLKKRLKKCQEATMKSNSNEIRKSIRRFHCEI